ncbi:metallophosphoesterase [Mesorhizobium sp. CN5-321]
MTGIHFLDARTPAGMALYAIGDIHGRLDLLAAMHEAIAAEIARDRPADWRIVHLGDYVDRGPDSSGVIEFLVEAGRRDRRNLFLAGNHELGMLDFLAKPDLNGLFARYGGPATARSYGVDIEQGSAQEAAAALAAAMPSAHMDFLHRLAFSASFGDFFFCHAGIKPGVPLENQSERDLVWIREPFLTSPDLHPKLVVHGHTPGPEAEIMPNRVNIDTLAWSSGRLTALAMAGAGKSIIEVSENGAVQRSEAVTP